MAFWNRKAERLAQANSDMLIRAWLLQQQELIVTDMVDWYNFGDFVTIKLSHSSHIVVVSLVSEFASPRAFSGLYANNGRVSMRYRQTEGNNFSLRWSKIGDKIRFTDSKPSLKESEAVA